MYTPVVSTAVQGTTRSPVSPPLVDARVTGEDGASDLDFGVIPLRRSSPQVYM